MKILKLTLDGLLKPITAQAVEKNSSLYYNIYHGAKSCWEYRCAVDSRIATPRINKDLILKEDHFIFRYLKDSENNNISDQLGNIYIVISKNSTVTHKKDILLFWDLGDSITDLEYNIEGFANEIGIGYNGNQEIKYPAPVIEIYGDCKLSYTGLVNDVLVNVSYSYDHNNSILKRI